MPESRKTSHSHQRSICPIACTLDIVGDKWTLLLVRDFFAGKKTYGELQRSPENIPTNILADRLKRLIEWNIIEKVPYQQKPIRYEYSLTDKGRDLGTLLLEIVNWGEKHIPGSKALMKKL